MPNGRCKVHGGKSIGPRTPEGLERFSAAASARGARRRARRRVLHLRAGRHAQCRRPRPLVAALLGPDRRRDRRCRRGYSVARAAGPLRAPPREPPPRPSVARGALGCGCAARGCGACC
jgi:hypothetical protein